MSSRLNPLRWDGERRSAFFVSLVVGALVGTVIGFLHDKRAGLLGLDYWFFNDESNALTWAVIGAAIVGGVIYVRALSR
jgi:hypothetical protein